jgi:urocanate hydratase
MFDSSRPSNSGPAGGNGPIAPIYSLYAALAWTLPLDPENGLGGRLLYAGELAGSGCDLVYAGNVAGAASLAASADAAAQRQAVRDGVVDFLVTSLEEALRILKNEIRKQRAVSVGVSIGPERLVTAMLDRGVLPDVLPPAGWAGLTPEQAAIFLEQGAREVGFDGNLQDAPGDREALEDFVSWTVESTAAREFAVWLPKLDGWAQRAIPAEDLARQRWLRLAPRYLGRLAQRERGAGMTPEEAGSFFAQCREAEAGRQSDVVRPGILVRVNGEDRERI